LTCFRAYLIGKPFRGSSRGKYIFEKSPAMKHFPRQTILPYTALGVCILALSTSAIFIKFADAPGPVTGFYRMFIATVLLSPFAIRSLIKNKQVNRKNLFVPLIGGVFSGLDLGIWSISLGFTSAANATLLGNTAPLWVALGAMLIFREKLQKKYWVGLFLAMSGASLIVSTDFLIHPSLGWGDIIALLTGLFYAGYYLTAEFGRRSIDAVSYIWIVFLSASLTLFVLNMLLGNPLAGFSQQTILIFIATAIISQLIGYLMSSYALGHLPASVVSVTMVGQPIMTALLAIPLLGEVPGRSQIMGGLVALAGIYLVNVSHENKKP
jgi:drug/metabolite transporter (DMT)-like permease